MQGHLTFAAYLFAFVLTRSAPCGLTRKIYEWTDMPDKLSSNSTRGTVEGWLAVSIVEAALKDQVNDLETWNAVVRVKRDAVKTREPKLDTDPSGCHRAGLCGVLLYCFIHADPAPCGPAMVVHTNWTDMPEKLDQASPRGLLERWLAVSVVEAALTAQNGVDAWVAATAIKDALKAREPKPDTIPWQVTMGKDYATACSPQSLPKHVVPMDVAVWSDMPAKLDSNAGRGQIELWIAKAIVKAALAAQEDGNAAWVAVGQIKDALKARESKPDSIPWQVIVGTSYAHAVIGRPHSNLGGQFGIFGVRIFKAGFD